MLTMWRRTTTTEAVAAPAMTEEQRKPVRMRRGAKFTIICVCIYVIYGLFIFVALPLMLPDPVTMLRRLLLFQTRKFGNLSDFTIEAGGKPMRSLLLTFRGSGAINLLDNLTHQPGCYHHFAPLIAHQKPIEDDGTAMRALEHLINLYNCNYNGTKSMLRFGRKSSVFSRFYGRHWKLSLLYPEDVSWDPEIMEKICRIYPFINMSVYNLGLKYIAMLLRRDDLNVRIIQLVRDPRAIMINRAIGGWCVGHKECYDINYVCSELLNDYYIADKLAMKYPHRFSVVRYEDLAQEPEEMTQQMFNFYGIPLLQDFGNMERQRTTGTRQDIFPFSWFKRPEIYSSPFQWLRDADYSQIERIQNNENCSAAMEIWGYRKLHTSDFYNDDFDPLMQPPEFVF